METFDHERLEVYQLAKEWVCASDSLIQGLPQGRAYLADQLHRAATSVLLNIAEGAGEFSKNDKCRFYRMAKRSATECAAVLDICRCLKLADERGLFTGRVLLLRIVSMLVRLIHSISGTDTDRGTGTRKERGGP
jgi:four helix bundle protein